MGVSSCPTGIAHTYMAAEALEQAGKERGVTVSIEGQGSGKIDWLDPALIKRADAVVFAHDLPVKGRDRFAGKPMVDVGVKAAVNDAGALIDQALAAMKDPDAVRVPAGGDKADDAEEEDLADVLVDALSNLDDGGLIWVLIPKPGRTGSLPVADVEDAATIAGLHSTTAASVGSQWAGIRLTARPRQR